MIKKYKILALLLSVSILMSCSADTGTINAVATDNSSGNPNVELDIKTMSDTIVEYENNDFYNDWKNENTNYINLTSTSAVLQGNGAEINENLIIINAPGTYVVSGILKNGQIIVDSGTDEAVRLVLNNVDINCVDNAPIYIKNSGKTIITLAEDTENIITDGSAYKYDDPSTEEPNAAIFSKSDLTFNGSGTLTVNANYNNGIVGKDILKITDGNININSVDDGLLGRDLIAVKNGNLTINSQGDGLKATNDSEIGMGNIVLEDGSFIITSGSDGIQAENGITIIDGKYAINSMNDSIHSNNSIDIYGGTINISSDDDGIHADSVININKGTINILKSYEGIESSIINISNGNIQIVATDDGINVAGGNDSSAINSSKNNFSSTENNNLNISGGTIYVNSFGDGLDANGSIYMSGGTVIVNGPESNGNGSLDYDHNFEITGGLLIASGSSGMAQTPSETSTQNSVLISYSQVQKSGTIVNLSDSNGKNIITFAPVKDYQSILLSSPDLIQDLNYTLYSGGNSTGIENNGLFSEGSYENGAKLTDFVINKSVLSISETGEEVTGGGIMPGQGGRGIKGGEMRPDNKNIPEGQRPKIPNNITPDSSTDADATQKATDIENNL